MRDLFKLQLERLERSDGGDLPAFGREAVAESIAILLKRMVLADGIERGEEMQVAFGTWRGPS